MYNTNLPGKPLSDHHRRQLEEISGITREVREERGYRTGTRRADLPEAFKDYQRRAPALVVPTYSPDKVTTSHQIKPDSPRRDKKGKPVKYETPTGSRIIIDVHPRMMERVRDGHEPIWITEGIKAADSLTSSGVPTIALIGVWMGQKEKKLLPCWDHVPLHGRVVYIVFDHDVTEKEGVQLALERQARLLEERGADVRIVYLAAGDVDDHIAAGGTIKELKMMARRFDPEDVARFRLQRYPDLRIRIEVLREMWWEQTWKGLGGHTRRDIMKELTSAAARHGAATDDGARVSISTRTLQLRAGIGSRTTITKGLHKLEEEGFIRREVNQAADKAAAYVLLTPRARMYQVDGKEEEKKLSSTPSHPGGTPLRAPRLRWTYVGCKAHRRRIKGSRRVRSVKVPARERIERLGKVRGAVLDALDRAGGSCTLRELCEVLHRKRPRDLRRRVLPMLVEAGIVVVDDQLVTLTPGWLEALEEDRERGEEIAVERRTRDAHRRQREAFHHLKHLPDKAPTDADLRAQRERFKAALEARVRARHDRMRDAALEAFCDPHSGARKNLDLAKDGELANVEYIVNSVMAHQGIPIVRWEREFGHWREPVLAAASIIARSGIAASSPVPSSPPEPELPPDDYRDHPLDCECDACSYPVVRFARPYRGSGRRSA